MNKNFIYGLALGLGVLALFGFKSVVDRPAPVGGTKWEYMSVKEMPTMGSKKFGYYITGSSGIRVERVLTVEDGGYLAAEMIVLNEYGKQGWEICSGGIPIPSNSVGLTHSPTILKRPVQE